MKEGEVRLDQWALVFGSSAVSGSSKEERCPGQDGHGPLDARVVPFSFQAPNSLFSEQGYRSRDGTACQPV